MGLFGSHAGQANNKQKCQSRRPLECFAIHSSTKLKFNPARRQLINRLLPIFYRDLAHNALNSPVNAWGAN
jgi:hypothetical protein